MKKYIVAALIALFVIPLAGCRLVTDGEVGVSSSFGDVRMEELGTGVAFAFPVVRSVSVYSTRIQETTQEFSVPTKDGMIVTLSATLLASREPSQVAEQKVRIQGNPWKTVVLPVYRSSMRDNVAAFPIEAVYKGEGRELIKQRVEADLRESLTDKGFLIDSVEIRDLQLPTKFTEAVERKLAAEQAVQQKVFMLEQAKKDAEIEVARAEGAAQAQEIIHSTLTENYLRYRWIETLNDNPNVVYVATEANLPIFKSASSGAGR